MESNLFQIGRSCGLDYLVHIPAEASGKPLPLLVYLHGLDGCDSDPMRILEIESIPYYLAQGTLVLPEPAVILAPQCPDGHNWADMAENTMALIEAIQASAHTDPERVSVTGASLGGMGSFELAIRNPERFSCIVPVCAKVAPERCGVLTHAPFRIFHGEKDTGMGFSVIEADRVIREAGGQSELTMIKDWGHEIRWVYTAPEYRLIEWMLSQRRK